MENGGQLIKTSSIYQLRTIWNNSGKVPSQREKRMMMLLLVNHLVDPRLTSDRSKLYIIGRNNCSDVATSFYKHPLCW